MKPALSVIKIGGNVIENSVELSRFLNHFNQVSGPKVLVHGGGKKATLLGEKLGIRTTMVNGRRVTIVSELQALGCNAIGLSGTDADVIRAVRRPAEPVDFGFVGDIQRIQTRPLLSFLEIGLVPVFCALSHDGKGQMLNTNADSIASALAIALSRDYSTTLYYCFEKPGVLSNLGDDQSVIPHINKQTYYSLLREKTIGDGMLPKLENCFHALDHSVHKVCIGNVGMLSPKPPVFTTLTL